MTNDDWLRAEEYAEPRCLLCDEPHGAKPKPKMIPQGRVMAKYDEYTGRNDYAGAERHMLYWLREAELGADKQGQFQIHNELMGLYRKTGQEEKAFESMEAALALAEEMHIDTRPAGATALLNAATVCSAFRKPQQSLPLFVRAREIYEQQLPPENPALTLVALDRFDEADELYQKALRVMAGAPNGALEQAITYLNMADVAYLRMGAADAEPVIDDLLTTALGLLEQEGLPRNGYYAFVCEKCAPTFLDYGWTAYGKELRERAREIYEGA